MSKFLVFSRILGSSNLEEETFPMEFLLPKSLIEALDELNFIVDSEQTSTEYEISEEASSDRLDQGGETICGCADAESIVQSSSEDSESEKETQAMESKYEDKVAEPGINDVSVLIQEDIPNKEKESKRTSEPNKLAHPQCANPKTSKTETSPSGVSKKKPAKQSSSKSNTFNARSNAISQKLLAHQNKWLKIIDNESLDIPKSEDDFNQRHKKYESWNKILSDISQKNGDILTENPKIFQSLTFLEKSVSKAIEDLKALLSLISEREALTFVNLVKHSTQEFSKFTISRIVIDPMDAAESAATELELTLSPEEKLTRFAMNFVSNFSLGKRDSKRSVLFTIQRIHQQCILVEKSLSEEFLIEASFPSNERSDEMLSRIELNGAISIERQKQILKNLSILEQQTVSLFELIKILKKIPKQGIEPEATGLYQLADKLFAQFRAAWYFYIKTECNIQIKLLTNQVTLDLLIQKMTNFYEILDSCHSSTMCLATAYFNLAYFQALLHSSSTPELQVLSNIVNDELVKSRDYSVILRHLPVYDLDKLCDEYLVCLFDFDISALRKEGDAGKLHIITAEMNQLSTIFNQAMLYHQFLPNRLEMISMIRKISFNNQ
jgi:hypothetical protein